MFAEIAVNAPLSRKRVPFANRTEGFAALGQTFTYAIPAHLADTLRPGHLVIVPFGVRKLEGIVMALSERTAVERLKEVDAIVDPVPVLTPAQLELARWISEYYFAPLIDCVLLMFPPGLESKLQTTLTLNPELANTPLSSPAQLALVERLRTAGTLPLDNLLRGGRDRMPGPTEARETTRAINALVEKQILFRHAHLLPPKAKTKVERTAQLIAEPSAEALGKLKSAKQKAVLDYLHQQGGIGVINSLHEITQAAGADAASLKPLADAGYIKLDERVVWRDPLQGKQFARVIPPMLTPQQQRVWTEVRARLSLGPDTFLLLGVTGSGKTEIYLRAVGEAIARGKQAIVLVPEISLTPQTIRRFAERFPDDVTVVHGQLSLGERYDQWRRIRAGEVNVVVGSRTAIFAPLPRLGLIVLDEEHEHSYKQERSPNFHAREVALHYAQLTKAVVLLGSATPSLESIWKAQQGEFRLLELTQRVANTTADGQQTADGGRQTAEGREKAASISNNRTLHDLGRGSAAQAYAVGKSLSAAGRQPSAVVRLPSALQLPPVEIVDMRAELKTGNTSIFSRALRDALSATLKARQQAILYLNRRGTATFVMCRDCGYVMRCRRCDSPLTWHTDQSELVCHHCNRRYNQPTTCPNCGSRRIRQFGAGTQKVEEDVQKLFPTARVLRWDRDVTGAKGSHEAILKKFSEHQADVLVGTQMIAKGLDLPLVTLVGVISADTGLHLPDFRSGERTFQLLTQVAGRSGRSRLLGKAIFQTYTPGHPAIVAAAQHNVDLFYESELAFRKQLNYPPFSRLIRLLYVGPGEERAQREAESLHRSLSNHLQQLSPGAVDLIGPAPCFAYKLRGNFRWQIIVRGAHPEAALRDFALPLGWRIDVDPLSVL